MSVGSAFQRIVEKHVGVKRIILRPGLFLSYRVIQRGCNLCLIGEELTKFNISRKAVCLIVIL